MTINLYPSLAALISPRKQSAKPYCCALKEIQIHLDDPQLMFLQSVLKTLQWHVIYNLPHSSLRPTGFSLISEINFSSCKSIWFHLILPCLDMEVSWWVSLSEKLFAYLEADYLSWSIFSCRLKYLILTFFPPLWVMLSKQSLVVFRGLSTIHPCLESRDGESPLRLSQDSVWSIREKGGQSLCKISCDLSFKI